MTRTFPLLVLLASTLIGVGGGVLTNAVVSRLVALPDGAVLDTPSGSAVASAPMPDRGRPAPVPRGPSEQDYMRLLLCRNLMDLDKVGQCSFNQPKEDVVDDHDPRTDLQVTLLGTLVASPARYSSALILEEGAPRAYGYSIDDKIKDATIVGIEQKLVRLRRGDGREEILTMSDDAVPRPAPSAAPAASADAGDGEVTQLGENSFAIDGDVLNKYLADLEGLSRMGRALLHRGPDGEFDGYRLSAIRRNTIADKLGIRNGDIIHSVNGKPLNSMQAAMEAYNTMQNDKNFKLEITRRGERQTNEYTIQ